MKRIERQHLKHNELATTVGHARHTIEEHRSQAVILVVAAVVVLLAVGGWVRWRSQVNDKAGEMLASAMRVVEAPVTPPPTPGTPAPAPAPGSYATERVKQEAALRKLLAAADVYPGTQAASRRATMPRGSSRRSGACPTPRRRIAR